MVVRGTIEANSRNPSIPSFGYEYKISPFLPPSAIASSEGNATLSPTTLQSLLPQEGPHREGIRRRLRGLGPRRGVRGAARGHPAQEQAHALHRQEAQRRGQAHGRQVPTLGIKIALTQPLSTIIWTAEYRHNDYTFHLFKNLLLTSKQKFCFGLTCPGLAKTELLF